MRTVLCFALLTLVNCASQEVGTEGGPCYGNETCNGGLTCLSDLCVDADSITSQDNNDKNPSDNNSSLNDGGVPPPPPPDTNDDCNGVICSENEVCVNNLCEIAHQCLAGFTTESIAAALRIELTWDRNHGDLDIHATKANSEGEFCMQGIEPDAHVLVECNTPVLDCYYANCRESTNNRPDWNDDGISNGHNDPQLTRDDFSGFGPEIIKVDTISEGEYIVGVDYFGSINPEPVFANVSIYLFHQPFAINILELSEGSYFSFFKIIVDETTICLEDLQQPLASGGFEYKCASITALSNSDCIGQECSLCEEDSECGLNQSCFQGFCMAECVAHGQCGPSQSCYNNQCITPECQRDLDCHEEPFDSRYECSECGFCELPEPACENDNDEPNNTIDEASEMTGNDFSGTICREDSDYISFIVNPEKRYDISITFWGGDASSLNVELLDSSENTLNETWVGGDAQAALFTHYYGTTSSTHYLRINGTSTATDLWDYDIEIAESTSPTPISCTNTTVEIGPDSSDEQYEPNDTFETAHTLNISSQSSLITSFGRCDDIHTDETCDEDTACATSSDICLDNTCVTRDVDWYKLILPAHTAVEVTAEFVNAYGDLELGLCTSAQCGHEQAGRLDYSDGFSGIETVNTSDAYDTLWVRVKLFWSNFYPTEQTYILSINPTELPHSNDTEVSDAGPTDTPTLMDAGLTDTPTLMDAGPTDGGL